MLAVVGGQTFTRSWAECKVCLRIQPKVVVVLPGSDAPSYYQPLLSLPPLGSAPCLLRLPVSLVLM